MLALYFLFPHGETEEITAAPSDLIMAETPQPIETPTLNKETLPVEQTQSEKILIEIKGQVEKPGVFELPAESRLHMAVDLAGGFLPDADALSLNLAMKLTDEMSIYVPKIGETTVSLPPVVASPSTAAGSAAEGAGRVNINTADETGLMMLPGIGPSKAAAIIAYREENGPFITIDALKDVTGIGDKTYEQLQDSITAN
ncbi:helix-hairpin-helix domain-containing protein [Planomicrobium okeanokoites]|uniref:Helix-hairpin-helix domain-containing protein n=1 Tax=Planomicrobium okeanokoites TaxID=244 RepID=A0ABV7KQR4_PLAOK|nr:helix-hairpin-helix domain-containing protein [Planomicrobium okeanokoites]